MLCRLDNQCQLWPSDGKTEIDWDRTRECGEAIAQVPDESMPPCDDASGRCLLKAAHGSEALFEVTMISLAAVVEVARAPMLGVGKDCSQGGWVARGLVRRDSLRSHAGLVDRAGHPLGEERLRRPGVPPL